MIWYENENFTECDVKVIMWVNFCVQEIKQMENCKNCENSAYLHKHFTKQKWFYDSVEKFFLRRLC